MQTYYSRNTVFYLNLPMADSNKTILQALIITFLTIVITCIVNSHDEDTIRSLQSAGLGFYLRDEERIPKLGKIVYMVFFSILI